MMKHLRFLLLLSVFSFIFLSCSEDEEETFNCADSSKLNASEQELTRSRSEWSSDPTNEIKCNQAVNVYRDYIADVDLFIKECGGVSGTNIDQWEEALENAKQQLDVFPCS